MRRRIFEVGVTYGTVDRDAGSSGWPSARERVCRLVGSGKLMAWGAACCAGRNVSVHSRVALSPANAPGPDLNGAARPPGTGSFWSRQLGSQSLAARLACSSPPVARAAAFWPIGLLAAMFPANVHVAQQGLIVAGRPASPLLWRLPLQLFWMWALWWTTRSRERRD